MDRDLLTAFAVGLPLAIVLAVLTFSFGWSGQAYQAGELVVIGIAVTAMILLGERRRGERR